MRRTRGSPERPDRSDLRGAAYADSPLLSSPSPTCSSRRERSFFFFLSAFRVAFSFFFSFLFFVLLRASCVASGFVYKGHPFPHSDTAFSTFRFDFLEVGMIKFDYVIRGVVGLG